MIDGLLIKMSHSYSVKPHPVRVGFLATYCLCISCSMCVIKQLFEMSDLRDGYTVRLALDQHLVKGLSGLNAL